MFLCNDCEMKENYLHMIQKLFMNIFSRDFSYPRFLQKWSVRRQSVGCPPVLNSQCWSCGDYSSQLSFPTLFSSSVGKTTQLFDPNFTCAMFISSTCSDCSPSCLDFRSKPQKIVLKDAYQSIFMSLWIKSDYTIQD